MQLVEIPQSGELPADVPVDDFLRSVLEATVSWYQLQVNFVPPWVSYVAMENGVPVGVCAFKTAPQDGRAEIAYGTAPGHEGRGIATAMARELILLAHQTDPNVQIFAQTLPHENASTSLLKKLGFQCIGSVEHPEDGTVWEWELR